jgi:hypothetical protein
MTVPAGVGHRRAAGTADVRRATVVRADRLRKQAVDIRMVLRRKQAAAVVRRQRRLRNKRAVAHPCRRRLAVNRPGRIAPRRQPQTAVAATAIEKAAIHAAFLDATADKDKAPSAFIERSH